MNRKCNRFIVAKSLIKINGNEPRRCAYGTYIGNRATLLFNVKGKGTGGTMFTIRRTGYSFSDFPVKLIYLFINCFYMWIDANH